MHPFNIILLVFAAVLSCASGQSRNPAAKPLRVYHTWTVFLHPTLGFELPIPPGVSAVGIPEAQDEPRFQSADRGFVMSAWGGMTNGHPAKVLDAEWKAAQRQGGREITYQRRGNTWFVVSGTDVRGIEFYEKFTMRGQQVAFLDITFPRSRMRQFEPWVERIEDGFRPVTPRGGPPGSVRKSPRHEPLTRIERTPVERKNSPEPEPPEKPTNPSAVKPSVTKPSVTKPSVTKPSVTKPSATKPSAEKPPETKRDSLADSLPSAEKVAGKTGFVYSPFSADRRLVDVTDIPSGTKVKCPYTMKIFRVP